MLKTVCIKDSYTFYKKLNREGIPNRDYREGKPVYLDIVNGLMKFLMKKVLDGFDVRLGAKLGIISIVGKKIKPIINKEGEVKGIAPNWGETKKLQAKDPIAKENKTIVYCFNEHSNGIKYNFCWGKTDVVVENKTLYNISFSRWNRRELARRVIKENKEYLIKI